MPRRKFDVRQVVDETLKQALAEIDKQVDGLREILKDLEADEHFIAFDYEDRFHAINKLGQALEVIEGDWARSSGTTVLHRQGQCRLADSRALMLPDLNFAGVNPAGAEIRSRIHVLWDDLSKMHNLYPEQGRELHELRGAIRTCEIQQYELSEMLTKVEVHKHIWERAKRAGRDASLHAVHSPEGSQPVITEPVVTETVEPVITEPVAAPTAGPPFDPTEEPTEAVELTPTQTVPVTTEPVIELPDGTPTEEPTQAETQTPQIPQEATVPASPSAAVTPASIPTVTKSMTKTNVAATLTLTLTLASTQGGTSIQGNRAGYAPGEIVDIRWARRQGVTGFPAPFMMTSWRLDLLITTTIRLQMEFIADAYKD